MAKEFRITREPFDYPEFTIYGRARKGLHMLPIEYVETESVMHTEPVIKLMAEEAQQLMDELWRAGLRPTEGTGSAGSLAATEKHLNDMRKIAFNKLKING